MRLAQSKLNELTARQGQELVQAEAQLEQSGEQLKKLRLDYVRVFKSRIPPSARPKGSLRGEVPQLKLWELTK